LRELKDRLTVSHEEEHVVRALIGLAEEYEITCVMQVGAEDGYEADKIRSATGARAVCIDGDPKVTSCSTNVAFYRCLVGDEDKMVDFWVNEQSGLSSKIERKDQCEQHVVLEQYRIDSLCKTHDIKPDMLIIDTEGTTLEVLRGAGEILDRIKIIYAEVQTREIRPGVSLFPEVDAFLVERGFKRREGNPEYMAGGQGNFTWVRA
jgi:FkbM family methyltransferase